MKLNKTHYIVLTILVIMLLLSTTSYGQGFGDLGFPDDVDDETPAPINGLIAIGLVVGGYLGIKKVRK